MSDRSRIFLAMFLTVIPVTLLAPGLPELVIARYGVGSSEAHAFMTVNLAAGMIGVPIIMRLLRRVPHVRRWLVLLLTIDAAAFIGMGMAPSLPALLVWRAVDGSVHLPAVTLLMVAADRAGGAQRGAALGSVASALMLGIAVGSPLGGWLVGQGGWAVYGVGAAVFASAAACSAWFAPVQHVVRPTGRRYRWSWRVAETWVPLGYAFMDRFSIGIFVSTFTLFLASERGITASGRGVLVAAFMLPFAALCYPAARLAEARGWLLPMLAGSLTFGAVYASYGVVPPVYLPVAMVLCGVSSALMFAPSLLLVSDLVRRGHGEGLYGAFQVAGSLGFLAGPAVGGTLVAVTGQHGNRPAYELIFASVGALEVLLAAVSYALLRRVAQELRAAPREAVG